MTKVNTVKAAQKDQGNCGSCGDALPAGSPYRHAKPGFRGAKLVRCMKPECSFRPSELATGKKSMVYASQEAAEAAVEGWDGEDLDTLKSDLESAMEDAQAAVDEWREASQNWGDSGNEEWDGLADEVESWVEEVRDCLDSVADRPSEEDFDDTEGELTEAIEDWVQQVRDEASTAVGNVPV